MVGGRVNIGFCAFLESEPTIFQGMDDLTARLGRNKDIVGEIRRDEEDGAGRIKSAGLEECRRKKFVS